MSTGDFVPALEQFLGSTAGLSSATVSRLTATWTDRDHKAFSARDLSELDFVYVWADGVHLKVRLDETKVCVLVMIGGRVDGSKELIALAEGYWESAESWAGLLRDAGHVSRCPSMPKMGRQRQRGQHLDEDPVQQSHSHDHRSYAQISRVKAGSRVFDQDRSRPRS